MLEEGQVEDHDPRLGNSALGFRFDPVLPCQAIRPSSRTMSPTMAWLQCHLEAGSFQVMPKVQSPFSSDKFGTVSAFVRLAVLVQRWMEGLQAAGNGIA